MWDVVFLWVVCLLNRHQYIRSRVLVASGKVARKSDYKTRGGAEFGQAQLNGWFDEMELN